ncbi:MAG: Maf family protein [Eubacterium sp.]|nr:Maf family protein [Eubacterium sp.]
MNLILASASPRRKDLLTQAGLSFTLRPADADETLCGCTPPEAAVTTLALRKAKAAFKNSPDEVILAADTVVALGRHIFGKPSSREEAKEMLALLSGKTHQVYTGVCLYQSEEHLDVFFARTDVTFYPLTDAEIQDYLNSGEYADKAGAYGIQGLGGLLVKKIDGDFYNVVGLPIAQVVRHLRAFL